MLLFCKLNNYWWHKNTVSYISAWIIGLKIAWKLKNGPEWQVMVVKFETLKIRKNYLEPIYNQINVWNLLPPSQKILKHIIIYYKYSIYGIKGQLHQNVRFKIFTQYLYNTGVRAAMFYLPNKTYPWLKRANP